MTDKINELLRRVEEFKPKAANELEEFRIRILGKKGELNALMEEFKTVAPELKRELGQQLNRLKSAATERIAALREELQNAAADQVASSGDLTRPRLGRTPRLAPPDFAGPQPDRRGLFAAGLYRGRRPRDRGRLACLLGAELPARTPGTRHAGHVLHREGHSEIARRTPRRSRSARWSARNRPSASSVRGGSSATRPSPTEPTASSTDRGSLHRRGGFVRRHEAVAVVLRQGDFRRAGRHPDAPVVLPLHGTFGRGRRLVQPLRPARDVRSARERAGSKSWGAAWSTPMS